MAANMGAAGADKGRPRVAILQSCYIPWKGYFDIIGMVDVFVVYDDVQYSKNHWHNRNRIKTQHGLKWLTIPVSKAEGAFQPIDRVRVSAPFARKHWASIAQAHARAPHFNECAPWLEDLYAQAEGLGLLSEVNLLFMQEIAARLGLSPRFVRSSELEAKGVRTDRLVAICRELGAASYLSGPSARAYIEEDKFTKAGIRLDWMDYSGYPEYPQLHGPFEHAVSIVDLLLNAGPGARNFMKTGQSTPAYA